MGQAMVIRATPMSRAIHRIARWFASLQNDLTLLAE